MHRKTARHLYTLIPSCVFRIILFSYVHTCAGLELHCNLFFVNRYFSISLRTNCSLYSVISCVCSARNCCISLIRCFIPSRSALSTRTFCFICRIYYLPNLLRIFEKSCKFRPIFIPGFKNVRILLIPLFTKFFLCIFCIIKINRAIDFLKVRAYRFSVLVRHKFAAVSYLMNDTELIFCLWKYRIYCITKSSQIIVASDKNIRNTAVFQV